MALIATLLLALPGLGRAATITVDTTGDPGPAGTCDLRAAIANANNQNQSGSTNCAAGNCTDTINFSVSGAITLGSTLPAIANTSPGSLTHRWQRARHHRRWGQFVSNSHRELKGYPSPETSDAVSRGLGRRTCYFEQWHPDCRQRYVFGQPSCLAGVLIENASPFNRAPRNTATVTNSTFSANVSRPVDGVVFAGRRHPKRWQHGDHHEQHVFGQPGLRRFRRLRRRRRHRQSI